MKDNEITLETIYDAMVKEVDKYHESAKFHIEALYARDNTKEVREVHVLALVDIFSDCPLLLDYMITSAERNNLPLPNLFKTKKFKEMLSNMAIEQAANIFQNLMKGGK